MTKLEIVSRYAQAYYDALLARQRAKLKAKYAALSPEERTAIYLARKPYVDTWRANNLERVMENQRVRARKYYWQNLESHLARARKWKSNNRAICRVHEHKKRAKRALALGSHTAKEWEAILKAHNYRCAYCKSNKQITKDHRIPLARGGTNYAFNLQPLCRKCNVRKQAKLVHAPTLFDLANL